MPNQSPSPPTVRVITVMHLLAEADRPLTTTEIGGALDIARATATAILGELETAGWVERDAELAYSIGPTFGRLTHRADSRDALISAELARLAQRTGCGVTMSLIGPDSLVVIDKQQGGQRIIPGIAVGQRIPLAYPAGASVMPWRSELERAAWLATAPDATAASGVALLDLVRTHRVAVFRPYSDDAGLVDVLADLLEVVGTDLLNPALRDRALRQLAGLTSRPYTVAELMGDDALPVSYLTAPVFDGPDTARYEIQLGPLRAAVTKQERGAYIDAVRDAAQAIAAIDR